MSAHHHRPEVQARKIADLGNPEVQRRRAMYKAAKGKTRQRIADWNAAWNMAGRPRAFPDFPAWAAERAERWADEEREARAWNARSKRYHAAWVAGGMSRDFPNMVEWEGRS